jgi:hypothetical protein
MIEGQSVVSFETAGGADAEARSDADGCLLAAVIGLFLGLAWLFFSLRMYVKICLTKGFGIDDVLLVIANVGSRCQAKSCLDVSWSNGCIGTLYHVLYMRSTRSQEWHWETSHGYSTSRYP